MFSLKYNTCYIHYDYVTWSIQIFCKLPEAILAWVHVLKKKKLALFNLEIGADICCHFYFLYSFFISVKNGQTIIERKHKIIESENSWNIFILQKFYIQKQTMAFFSKICLRAFLYLSFLLFRPQYNVLKDRILNGYFEYLWSND